MSFSTSIRHLRRLSTTTATATATATTANASISVSKAKARLRSQHDPDKALEILSSADNTSSHVSLRYVQDLTIRRLSKARRFTDIENIIEPQKKDPKITQEPFLSGLIRSYARAGMFDHALRTFNEMDKLGTPRSTVSFNALLSACISTKKFDQVPKLFDEIPKKYSFSPDRFSYGILIKSLCESGMPESAYLKIQEMEEKDVEITAVTYTAILDSFYKKGNVDEADRIWKEMIDKGCMPDITAYNVRVMHAQEGKPEDLLALLEEIKVAGLEPDTISYNYLMTCYLKNEMFEDADKVYKGLEREKNNKVEKKLEKEKNKCPPNAATFRIYIDYLCKAGKFNKGFTVYKDSMRKDKVPSFGTLKALVEGLAKTDKKKEAKGVIRSMVKKFPHNVDAWKKLEADLGFVEENESAVKEAAA